MLTIDESFLEEAGLAGMPSDKKATLLAGAQEELEKRVGERMSQGMTVDQLKEFDGIMRGDEGVMTQMLEKIGNYREDEIFKKLLGRHGVVEETLEILGEYLSVKWVQINRPDYATIATGVAEEIRAEIMANRAELLG